MALGILRQDRRPFKISGFIHVYTRCIDYLNAFAMPIFMLCVRGALAKLFWYSGLVKISNWPATLYLFENVYKVPDMSVHFAAMSATSIELICPILLILGLATRLTVIPMFIMTCVIQYTTVSPEGHYWMMALILIFCYGPGSLSLDHWIDCLHRHFLLKNNS